MSCLPPGWQCCETLHATAALIKFNCSKFPQQLLDSLQSRDDGVADFNCSAAPSGSEVVDCDIRWSTRGLEDQRLWMLVMFVLSTLLLKLRYRDSLDWRGLGIERSDQLRHGLHNKVLVFLILLEYIQVSSFAITASFPAREAGGEGVDKAVLIALGLPQIVSVFNWNQFTKLVKRHCLSLHCCRSVTDAFACGAAAHCASHHPDDRLHSIPERQGHEGCAGDQQLRAPESGESEMRTALPLLLILQPTLLLLHPV